MDIIKQSKNSTLTGKLLLAMPGMGDPRFQHAVIFLCAHDDNGAMGLVINHVMPGVDFAHLLAQLQIGDGSPRPAMQPSVQIEVLSGGPVESARGFILHSSDYRLKDTIYIGDHFGVTGTVDALHAIAAGQGPGKMLFILGYAGWGAGQLDRELQENVWLITDADPGLIFGPDADSKWNLAIRQMGIDPAMLSGEAGRA